MKYSPYTVPVRTPLYDDQGRLSRQWLEYLSDVARKAGRSALWRGVYSSGESYSVCDMVRAKDGKSIWTALQAQPFNGRTVDPGTDDTVWELVWSAKKGGGIDPSDTVTALDGVGDAGTALTYSRGDHKHALPLDTDGALAADSDAKIATQKAVKTYVDGHTGASAWGSITGTLSGQTDLQTALDAKLDDSQLDVDGTLAANSDAKIASQKAVKTYVDASIGAVGTAWGDITGTLSAQTDLQAALDAKLDDSQLDVDATMAANSDAKIASQKATKAALDGKVPTTRSISTTAPITGGGDLSADRTLAISNFTGDSGSGGAKGAVPAPASGDAAAGKFLKSDGTWAVPPDTTTYPGAGVPQSTGSAWGSSLTLDTDGTLAANSDTKLATQKATKTYVDAHASPLTTKGDLYGYSTLNARVAVGTDGQVLSADSSQATGVKWVAAGAAGSIYYGNASATATDGQNVITLGSTPLTGSTRISLNGVLIPPANLSVSGAVVTYSGTWATGDVITALWQTANSTPGGITLSAVALIRGTGIGGSTGAASIVLTWPAGTVSGDLAIISLSSNAGSQIIPSGWTSASNPGGSFWTGAVFWKVLNSADIIAGSISLSPNGGASAIACIATIIGESGGTSIVETIASEPNGGAGNSLTTVSSASAGYLALYVTTENATNAGSVSRGTLAQSTTVASGGGALYTEALASSGTVTATFVTTGGTHTFQATILIASSVGGTLPEVRQSQIIGLAAVVVPSSPSDATKFLNGAATPAFAQVKDSDLSTSDVTTNNTSSTKHGFTPKSPADATQFLNGAATPAFAAVKDSDLSTSDITTNNVSTSKHGFAPKLPNDATKYLDGTGTFSTPTGGGGSYTYSGDIKASRAFGTVYQNTSGKLRYVAAWGSTTVADQIHGKVDSFNPPTTIVNIQNFSNSGNNSVSFFVPNNYYYSITFFGGTKTLSGWFETDLLL